MMLSLGYRMEDLAEVNYTDTQKLVALNDAQRQIISMVANAALVHLQVSEDLDTVQTDSNLGGLKYFALPSPVDGNPNPVEPLMNRFVKAYDNTNDRFVEMVTPNGFETSTSYNYGTLGTLMRNRLYISSSDIVSSCILVYVASAADIADNSNEIENLSDSVQQAIIELAESLLWRQDNKLNRAAVARQASVDIVTSINTLGI